MQKIDTAFFTDLYRHMLMARKIESVQADAAQRGEAFFYIPSAGHESIAALAPLLTENDWLHCHYRDRSLLLARGVTPTDILLELLGRTGGPSEGRRMPGFACSRELNLLSAPTGVASNALQAVGVAQAVKNDAGAPVVYCGIGDGGTQEGEFLEAIAEAVRSNLPVLFVVQDNHYALSTPSKGRTFFSLPAGDAAEFYGIPLRYVDGTDTIKTHGVFADAVNEMRNTRAPQIVIMRVERLTSHTNADDHSVYRTPEELARIKKTGDPVLNLAKNLIAAGVDEAALKKIEHEINSEIDGAFATARRTANAVTEFSAKRPLPESVANKSERRDDGDALTMVEAMRAVFRERLGSSPEIYLYGEDIEDPKGDVFGLTRGLSSAFPNQVINSPLSESTIVGAAIGQALAGKKPVACIQFADFMLPAFSQIAAELGAMWWRTNGQWECPVILMAICGAYRPGLGPYHAQTFDATFAHIPGLDIFMPSTAADAAGLLNAAFDSNRPTVFLFPKNLINDRSVCAAANAAAQFVPVGKARVTRPGKELTIVSWGSTVPLCEKTADALQGAGASVEVIDLRSLSPWDKDAVIASARKTGKLLVVHEDNHTCGFGGEVMATVAEHAGVPVQMARVTRADTYIPYLFDTQLEVLPTFKTVLEKAAELLDFSIAWQKPVEEADGAVTVNAIGSSPSDKTVTITELYVSAGDSINEGEIIASVEADKATMEISTPVSGTVDALFLAAGDSVNVGTPLARIKSDETNMIKKPVTTENYGTPVLEKRISAAPAIVTPAACSEAKPVYISSITTVLGSRKVTNEELVRPGDEWDSEAIRKRTGIENRYWITGDESAVSLAVTAVRNLLEKEKLSISDIDALVCSTGTPPSLTPSLACRVLYALSPAKGEVLMQAHDVSAACSGYLYALQNAWDILRDDPSKKVIVITAETLSPMINFDDPKTSVLFGDGATASLISCERRNGNINAMVNRPVLSATGVDEKVLYVPTMGSTEKIEMEGLTVFKLAVRKMIDMLSEACVKRGVSLEQLDMIVPHQANERIIEAIRKTIHCPPEKMFNHIRKYANISSNTIPFALEELMPQMKSDSLIGLTAFGGGFTFGGAVIEKQ